MEGSRMEPSTSGAGTGNNDNPMLNALILKNLSEVCADKKDIQQIRLVSNVWHETSLDAWRSTAPVVISVEKTTAVVPIVQSLQPQRGCRARAPCNGADCENANMGLTSSDCEETILEQIIRSTADTQNTDGYRLASKPFSSFKLKGWPLCPEQFEGPSPHPPLNFVHRRPETGPLSANQQEFWRVCGSQIKRLHLDECRCINADSFKVLFCKFTPSLVQLKIDGLVNSNSANSLHRYPPGAFQVQENLSTLLLHNTIWPISWADTFKRFPNLKTLELHGGYAYSYSYDLNRLLQAVATLRNEGQQIALKNLDLDVFHRDNNNKRISQATANLFEDARLSLDNLKIELGSDTEGSVVSKVLRQFSATLRTLHCTRTLISDRFVAPNDHDWTAFPKFLGDTTFEHLKRLSLNGLVARSFDFSQHTPSLEVLHVDYDSQDRQDETGDWRIEMIAYEVRTVVNTIEPISGSRMAKLEEFKTQLLFDNHEAYLNFGKWMPNLTRLVAPLTEVTFPLACDAWKSTLKELHITKEGTVGDEITGLGIIRLAPEFIPRRLPNITDLKELVKFSQDKGKCYFTDHAVWYGFACLPKLKTVQIFVMKELPPDALAILKKRNVNITWTKCED